MSPARPVHMTPAHMPVHVPSTGCLPSAATVTGDCCTFHASGSLALWHTGDVSPRRCLHALGSAPTSGWVGGRAAQETPECGVAPAWPRGAASMGPCTSGPGKAPPATPAPAVPATSPAGDWAPGRGKTPEVTDGHRRALLGEQQDTARPQGTGDPGSEVGVWGALTANLLCPQQAKALGSTVKH